MGERFSWAVGLTGTVGVVTVVDARLSMSALWTPSGQITSRTGVVPAAAEPGRVTATSPTPNGFVHVAPFRAVLQSGRGGGTYTLCLDAVKDINILATPANGSNPRIDLIVWQQSDTFFADGDSGFVVRHIVGAAAASPVDPAVSGSTDYIVRARVTVPAGATTIANADIANVALPWTVATGGLLPVRTAAERAAITAPYDGLSIYRMDRDWVEIYDGGNWRVQGPAICASTTDRDTSISSAYNGLIATTVDTYTVWQYRGGSWVAVLGTSAADTQNAIGTTTSSAVWTSILSGGGSPVACGAAFIAPPSGRVMVHNAARIGTTGAFGYCGVRVRTGAVVGSGSDFLADAVPNAVEGLGTSALTYSRPKLVTGLTPGGSYNVQQRFIVDSGTGSFEDKHLAVVPA